VNIDDLEDGVELPNMRLGEHDTTTDTSGDDTKDYAAGYSVIISKLTHLEHVIQSSTVNTPCISNNDSMADTVLSLRNMVIDVSKQIGIRTQTLQALSQEVMALKSSVTLLNEMNSSALAASHALVSISGVEQVNNNMGAASGIHTRQVSTVVPACMI